LYLARRVESYLQKKLLQMQVHNLVEVDMEFEQAVLSSQNEAENVGVGGEDTVRIEVEEPVRLYKDANTNSDVVFTLKFSTDTIIIS